MGRLVVFSVSSFCVAFVAAAGLAAYTAAHPFDAGVVAVSTSANPSRPVQPVPGHPRSAPRRESVLSALTLVRHDPAGLLHIGPLGTLPARC
jgi:hypothetical protein